LLVFDTTTESFWFYSGSWTELIDSDNSGWAKDTDTITANAPYVGIGTENPSRMLTLGFNNANLNTSHMLIEQSGVGDSWFNIGLTGSTHYAFGIDNSDGDKFKIGYSATIPGAVHTGTRLTIDSDGDVGIGTTTPMSERLHINSAAGQDPFRADVNTGVKFKIFSNGGTAVGSGITPPVNGLRVSGAIDPIGGISSAGNIIMTSTAGFVSITAAGSEIRIYANGQIDIDASGILNINSANTLNISSVGGLNLSSNGTLSLTGHTVSINSSTSMDVESGSGMIIDAGSALDIYAGNTMDIQTSAGTMNVKNLGGNLNISSAATVNVDGTLVDINNGTQGAARVNDVVAPPLIVTGSSTVKIGN
jgi:hypothetical protein